MSPTSRICRYISLHNPCRYVFVAVDGPVILFDFRGCEHLSAHSVVVDEVRGARSWYHFNSGPRNHEHVKLWSEEIDDLMRTYASSNKRIAIDKIDPLGAVKLSQLGYDIVEGQEIAHYARLIKTEEELIAIRHAVQVCQHGMRRMRNASEPGKTEQEIWSQLHQVNIEHGGEWIETRLLTSGPRTNPWYQECSDRVVAAGDYDYVSIQIWLGRRDIRLTFHEAGSSVRRNLMTNNGSYITWLSNKSSETVTCSKPDEATAISAHRAGNSLIPITPTSNRRLPTVLGFATNFR